MKHIPALLTVLLPLVACSTVKLQEGERALRRSRLKIEKTSDSGNLTVAELTPYIRTDEKYSERLQESSEENITKHLEYLGYYDSSVSSSVKLKKRSAKITYLVTPGRRIKIDSLIFNIKGTEEFIGEFNRNRDRVSVSPGDYLSEASLVKESERSAEYFRNLGYYGFNKNNYNFTADTLSRDGRLSLEYSVRQETPKYRIGDISVSYPGNLKFRDKMLEGLVPIRSGELYSDRKVNATYSRLGNLNLFNGVNVEISPRENSDTVDCSIRMSPGSIQGIQADLEASVNASGLIGVSPQVSYFHNNIFHGSEKLRLQFNGNFQYRPSDRTFAYEFGFLAGLSLPRFLGQKYSSTSGPNIPRTEFNASFSFQNRPEYRRRVFSFQYGYSGSMFRPGNYFTYQFNPFRLKTVSMHDMSEDFWKTIEANPMLWYSYMSHINAGENGTIYWSDSRDPLPKRTYRYMRASVSLSGNILSLFSTVLPKNDVGQAVIFGLPFTQYAKAEINLGYTWRLGKNDRMAIASRLVTGIGYSYGNSSAIPFDEQFYCGGANSMRGWQARSLGPGDQPETKGFVIPSQVGDLKLEADLEFRFPLFWKLEGALFAETGNVWMLHHPGDEEDSGAYFKIRDFYKSLAADWGLGVRLDLNFLLIRVDWGMKVRVPSEKDGGWYGPKQWFGKNGYAIHFGVGYPF